MISNSLNPTTTTTTPLSPFNNSPFSRGSRAVQQGRKKAKAYIIISRGDCEEGTSDLVKDENIEQSPKSTSENTSTSACDSRGSRAVQQGRKKAKAYIIISRGECEVTSDLVKDENIEQSPNLQSPNLQSPNLQSPNLQSPNLQSPNLQSPNRQSTSENSSNLACDSTILTPASKGILKRKCESVDGNCKKKVIFSDPISATKFIESITIVKPKGRRLLYDSQLNGPRCQELS